jgi:SHS family lactate transporter-like MFS transporter
MLMLGVLPALLIMFIRRHVPESPAWEAERRKQAKNHVNFFSAMKGAWPRLLYAVLLMTCFNFFSHGTQDLYPTFLRVQHRFSPGMVSALTILLNLGAMVGGLTFGALSEKIGRRKAIVLAALIALPVIPLWALSTAPLLLGLGAFLIQIAVQGAWGVVPVHLNELSPAAVRGTFPGFTYQIGNLFAAANAYIQADIAERNGNNYGLALAIVCGIVAVTLAVVTWFGPEAKGVDFAKGEVAKT